MKLLILGNARHGKTKLAELRRDNFGLKFKDSSVAASEIFLYDKLKDKYGYASPQECFEDRINHREERFNLISMYNIKDRTRLAKEILKENDCYVGMRARDEIYACKRQGLFDLIIRVDAAERMPPESKESFDITKDMAHFIIENNGSLEEFERVALSVGNILFK